MIDIKVEGVKEACEILSQLTKSMRHKVLTPALRRSMRQMLSTAKAQTPRRTGKLQNSLRIVRLRKTRTPTETAMAIKPVFSKTKSGYENSFYGHFIHAGTKERRPRKGKVLVFTGDNGELVFTRKAKAMPSKPFLEDAYKADVDNTINVFGRELNKSIEKFVSKNFKKI